MTTILRPRCRVNRPPGLKAVMQAFSAAKIDMNQFQRYHGPVYWAIGSLSNAVEGRKAALMAKYFLDFKSELSNLSREVFSPFLRKLFSRFR
jgi:hypothetical protein